MTDREQRALDALAAACCKPASRWKLVTWQEPFVGWLEWVLPDGSHGQCKRSESGWETPPPTGAVLFAWLKKGESP